MVCSICGQSGHNRRTCPQRNTTDSGGRVIQPMPPTLPPPTRRFLAREYWRKTIRTIIKLKGFVKVLLFLQGNNEDLKYAYLYWLKTKDTIVYHFMQSNKLSWLMVKPNYPSLISEGQYVHYIELTNQACLKFHKEKNHIKDTKRSIKLINMHKENYLIYWVIGNIMVHDIDGYENSINYMGLIPKNGTFKLKTMIGHRFYLVPHRLDIEPAYHPQTDKQFFIEPYVQINIHDKTEENIYIDEGDKLSELNKWKFNALKLDYLIKEMIKLGAKNNDVLECILDLHEDIHLDKVGEWYKDIAGIPSKFTNIT